MTGNRSGRECRERLPFLIANQAGQHVGLAILQANHGADRRLPNVGRPPNPFPEMLLNSTFNASDTASS